MIISEGLRKIFDAISQVQKAQAGVEELASQLRQSIANDPTREDPILAYVVASCQFNANANPEKIMAEIDQKRHNLIAIQDLLQGRKGQLVMWVFAYLVTDHYQNVTVMVGELSGEKLDFAWKKNSAGTLSFPTAGCYLCNINEAVWRNPNAHNLFEKLDRFPLDYTGPLTLVDVLEEQDQLPPLSMFSQYEFSMLVFGSLDRIKRVLSPELRTILNPILSDGVPPLTQAR